MTQYTRAAGSHVLQNFLESERAARSDLEKEFLKRPEALKETRENIDRVKSVAFGSLGWVFWLVLEPSTQELLVLMFYRIFWC
jgi:hypothetical protein